MSVDMTATITAYLGLGSNLGNRQANIRQAIELLGRKTAIERISSLYETQPWGFKDQPLFLNIVCQVRTGMSPRSLLELAKNVENALGRVPSFRNSPRIIDVDILTYGDRVIEEPDLSIPHPQIPKRAFVMVPLAEIAPDAMHPKEGKTMKQLAAKAKGKGKVRHWVEP
jgi:2-amino-4-hydroxy-6-hydroxymethyldihydropteridine diphosphokinase